MKILQTIGASLAATCVIAIFGSTGELSTFGACVGLAVGVFVFVMIDKAMTAGQEEKRKAREEEDRRFENGEMTPAERSAYVKRKLDFAEMAYRHGDLTLWQLEALRKKYTGQSTLLDNFGYEAVIAASDKTKRK